MKVLDLGGWLTSISQLMNYLHRSIENIVNIQEKI